MAHLLRELQNSDNLESINEIQFSLFSHQDIKRGSVADILTPETYDSNVPKNNGLFDHNMGSIDAAIICPIDEKKAELCPGYFGKIDMALPVFNNHFIPYVEKVLKCVCFRCSNLLIDKSDPVILKELEGKKGYSRFTTILALSIKNKKCSYNNGCFVLQPTKYTKLNVTSMKEKNNIVKIYAEFSQNSLKDSKVLNQQVFTPLICYQIFKKIKDEDVDFMGFSSKYSRPEWMIITSLAVPPPSVRPSVRQSDNQRSEDDLTYALCNIVKVNKTLKQVLDGSNNKKIDDYQGYLQYLVSTYMDNEIPGVPPNAQRSSYRPLKAITQRLKGKEGRIRGNIMGKRVDYSARTVISVDPNIDIDEYGVPQKIAMNLTFPEIVTKYNIKKLKKTIRNGPKKYPGAKTITKNENGINKNISLKHVDVNQVADNLQIGDIVHRHLLDGDICLFNRQPTLHRMSMMSHRIKILPFNTFRLNVSVCKPYNADFDGDEMNMHIPQSLQTFTELEQICLVPNHIISPGSCKPLIQITQDTLVGGYLLTFQDVRLTKDKMYNYMMFSKNYDGKLPEPAFVENGIEYWTGKQLFSLIIPDININQSPKVKVIRGDITSGFLNSDSLGSHPSGLIKQIFNAYGTEKCVDFLNDTQKLITRWTMDNSFTIGFGDSVIQKENRKVVKELINKYLEEIFELTRKAQHGAYANDLDDTYKASKLEFDMEEILSKLTEKVKDYLFEIMPKTNNFYIAGDKASGSKGDSTNVQQIMGLVGQQAIWGNRIDDGFTERTLPHFYRNDIGPDAKGFCRNSYVEGLSPSEMFFHSMGGRTGTIDTAIRTADSGYTSRKFIKAAEDLMVNYDLTIRNSNGNIVQFAYGDDNFDPIKLEKVSKIDIFEYDLKQMEEKYKFDEINDREYFELFMTKDAVDEMMSNKDYKNVLIGEYDEMCENQREMRYNYFKNAEAIGDIGTYIPINLYRVIPSQKIKFGIEDFHLCDMTPQYILNTYNEAMIDIVRYLPEKESNWKLFKNIFKSFLSLKRVMKEFRLNKMAFDSIILMIKEKMMEAIIHPGEMVGIIGAQTLGEISTQLTLNSVTYETEIIVRDENKKIQKIQIGDFIEREIRASSKVQYMEDKDTTYAECAKYYEIPSCDEDGIVHWKRIEAVTRHPVINEDGSNTMLKVTTCEEREVIVTKAKSLLKLVNGKITQVEGSSVKVGDFLPASLKYLDFEENYKLDSKDKESVLVPNEIDGQIIMENRNGKYIDVLFDKIKSIEEVSNTTNYAYDLTVDDTRNFNIYNGLCVVDTFHKAGVGAGSLVITQGIPRLREIINLTKNLKSKNMTIYLKEEFSSNKENARKVQSRFAYTQLKDVLSSSEILYDNKNGLTDKSEDREFIKTYKEFTKLFDVDDIDEECLSPWILRLTFDKESLMNRKITIQEIQETIKEKSHNDQDIECIFSDDSANDVVLRIRIKSDSKENFMDFLKDIEKQLAELSLRGITDVSRVELKEKNIMKFNVDGSVVPKKEWCLETDGSNLLDILADDAVDITRIKTTDILEFHEVYGIEATREMIYRELCVVFAGSSQPNPRHIQMLADIMTYRGKLMQIDRHGLNKNSEIGPIAKASFEEVMNIFTKAALFAEKDNMKGVSANILAGQFCKSGTNCFDILMDEEKLMEKVEIADYVESGYDGVGDTEVEREFMKTYNAKEPDEDIKDEDFEFGFQRNDKEFTLNSISKNSIILKELDNSILNQNKNINMNFEKVALEEPNFNENNEDLELDLNAVPMNEPNYDTKNAEDAEDAVDAEDAENNDELNFGAVNLEVPEYKEPEELPKKNIKTIKIKKIKEKEEKPKKEKSAKVGRKKKE